MEKLEDRIETLERDLKAATLDYLDIYAKVKKLFGRIVKAQDRAEASEAQGDASAPDNGTSNRPGVLLSGRAAEVQRRIEARRARLMGGGGS